MRDLGASFSRSLSVPQCADRFQPSGDQQMSGWAESRVFADAASLVSGTRGGYLRSRAGHSGRRNALAQLHSPGRISVYDAERMRLRLRQLSEDAGNREGENRVGWLEGKTSR